ncbi:uncharacterized protein LOC126323097 [Schistocerca gregaria]|uniref:uncharacterized protein LOC126323097 n=1 Tax=Schistocerca gregaria TaxID=7010 RepID=UPI00211DCE2F|nr:uncharacterized protein LOC126323097 [Schistocerca gregaria]
MTSAELQQKLQEIRARRRRRELYLSAKERLLTMVSFGMYNKEKQSIKSSILVDEQQIDVTADRPESPSADSLHSSISSLDVEIAEGEGTVLRWYTTVIRIIYILLWCTLYAVAVQMEFGVIYLIVSALCLIWLNTRVGPKKKGEISAYSVFNPNCESIDGTLKAEQFEREIRYGAASVH